MHFLIIHRYCYSIRPSTVHLNSMLGATQGTSTRPQLRPPTAYSLLSMKLLNSSFPFPDSGGRVLHNTLRRDGQMFFPADTSVYDQCSSIPYATPGAPTPSLCLACRRKKLYAPLESRGGIVVIALTLRMVWNGNPPKKSLFE